MLGPGFVGVPQPRIHGSKNRIQNGRAAVLTGLDASGNHGLPERIASLPEGCGKHRGLPSAGIPTGGPLRGSPPARRGKAGEGQLRDFPEMTEKLAEA